MKKIVCFFIRGYRYCLSPFLGQNCRFYPSCSVYAEEAVAGFGLTRGGYLILRRLLKCHPWHEGGNDPVPGCFFKTNLEVVNDSINDSVNDSKQMNCIIS